jgi:hypothetical protein
MARRSLRLLTIVCALALISAACRNGDPAERITSPRAHLGFDIGDDYQLASYTQLSAYLEKLEQESDRIRLVQYGTTSEGRPMVMAVVTSPANHRRLEHYRSVSRRLALAEGVTEEEAKRLAAQGKSVVWIDAGLHATEVANPQALALTLHQMAVARDSETLRVLDDVILLAAFSNPDGLELVADWYMREPEPAKRSMANLPVLYQKYIGHDNNRESLLMNMPESQAIGRVLYHEWIPQIMFNQHQSGPPGTVLFIGAMRDPSNPFLDPLMAPSMELVSAAVHRRFVAERKPGATSRSMASYQNWWNGGVRSTACFHNIIGILSEISGGPTPMEIAFLPGNLVGTNDNPFPVHPQRWHFRQTIDYIVTANRAMLDVASRHREDLLLNIYRMGSSSIERGSRDNWTFTSRKIAALEAELEREGVKKTARSGYPTEYFERLRTADRRDARGYIIRSDQRDFLTATKFVNALFKNGVTVHRATEPFEVGGREYPPGSYVVKTAQAFRPHILDNFEPQDYPDDFQYPGGPPVRPYDVAGYTLAYQMGVKFDRVLEGFDGPFERVDGPIVPPPGRVDGTGSNGFLLDVDTNDAFLAVNHLLTGGDQVARLAQAAHAGGRVFPAGSFYVAPGAGTAARVEQLAEKTGLRFVGLEKSLSGEAFPLRRKKIGVVDVYGGSMPSGWVQWLLGEYGFAYDVVFPPMLDVGGLEQKYDLLIFENGLLTVQDDGQLRAPSQQPAPEGVPAQYRDRIGAITAETTLPQLRRFVAEGGTIIAIGTSAAAAPLLGAPLSNALIDRQTKRPLSADRFYVPGSVLRVRVDNTHPLAHGISDQIDVFFSSSPVFRPGGRNAKSVAWFDSDRPLRSGWAWGQELLIGAAAVADTQVGKGRVLAFGPLIVFRAHAHGSFKFLFNSIYYSGGERVRLSQGVPGTE